MEAGQKRREWGPVLARRLEDRTGEGQDRRNEGQARGREGG
jgi:hypothetical protein